MALLSKSERKRILNEEGFKYTEGGIKAFQKKYMLRKSDWDGIWGPNTDNTARTVDNVRHLTKNFKPEDKLCFWYEGGAYINCEHVLKSMLGDMMFKYVKDDKIRRIEQHGASPDGVADDYEYVEDNDVVVY